MDAEESFFVIFRKPATRASLTVSRPTLHGVAELSGSWGVAFQSGRGAPETIRLPALGSLSEQSDPAIKYFSGVATYTRSFQWPKGIQAGTPVIIDLGRVGDVAEVRVNGQLAGTLWKAPWRLDVESLVHAGSNALDVRVADLWVNRLIGDAQPGARKITYTSMPAYKADAPLRPSGLLGPVTLWLASQ
jgi:hypothetical protein